MHADEPFTVLFVGALLLAIGGAARLFFHFGQRAGAPPSLTDHSPPRSTAPRLGSRSPPRVRVALLLFACLSLLGMAAALSHERRLDAAVTVSSFAQLRAAVAAAGSAQTVIEVDGDLTWTSGDGMDNSESIVEVNSGQNVLIRGSGEARSVLDAAASSSSMRRLFFVSAGGTLEISNLVLRNGYAASLDSGRAFLLLARCGTRVEEGLSAG